MRDRTRPPPPPDEVDTTRDPSAWLQQPVVWLGALILLLSIAACVATIALAWRHADAPVEAGARVMGVPVRDAAATQAESEAR